MTKQPFDDNPYAAPAQPNELGRDLGREKGKVAAPAVALLTAAFFGLIVTVFNLIFAVTVTPEVDPGANVLFQEMQRNSAGPVAAGIQATFVFVNVLILLGATQMLRMKSWGLGVMAAVLSMVNLGGACCLLGVPFGVWALVVLLQHDVRDAFVMTSERIRSAVVCGQNTAWYTK